MILLYIVGIFIISFFVILHYYTFGKLSIFSGNFFLKLLKQFNRASPQSLVPAPLKDVSHHHASIFRSREIEI